jgi:hypothetical protein
MCNKSSDIYPRNMQGWYHVFREYGNMGHFTAMAQEYPNFGFFYIDELLEPLPEFQSYHELCDRHHHD